MTTTAEKIKVMQAYEDGATIRIFSNIRNSWLLGYFEKLHDGELKWDWESMNYEVAPPSPTYLAGQRFLIDGDVHILAAVGSNLFALISLRTGNRYADPIEVEDHFGISQKEMAKMACGEKYQLIEKE